MEIEKQMFGKQMCAGPCRDHGTQSGLCFVGPARVSSTTPSLYSLQITLMIALFWEQALYLNSFRQLLG